MASEIDSLLDAFEALAVPNECSPDVGQVRQIDDAPFRQTARGCHTRCVFADMTHAERRLLVARDLIRCACLKGGLSKAVACVTERMFCALADSESLRHTQRKGIVEACLFSAARACQSSRSIREVADLFGSSVKVVCRAVEQVSNVLRGQGFEVNTRPRAREFTSRFLGRLPGSMLATGPVNVIANKLETFETFADEPAHVVAAVSICLHLGSRSARAVETISGVSRFRLRKLIKCHCSKSER